MEQSRLAQIAIDILRDHGVDYADVRLEIIEGESINISNGTLKPIERTISSGIGIRVIKDGAWGFAATDELTEKSIKDKALLAVEIARASATVNREPVRLASLEAVSGVYVSAHEIDPFTVSLDEKISFLQEVDSEIAEKGARLATDRDVFADFRKIEKYFVSSEGADIRQTIIQSGAGFSAGMVKSHREQYMRSYPTSSGQYECKGYELLAELKMKEAVPRIIEELKTLTEAIDCPQKNTILLLSGDQVSLQIHESVGHPLELDRVFGSERNFSGTSFATTDKLGTLKYASDIVNIYSDCTKPHGLASYGYDDEGVPSEQVPLITGGVLVNYLSSRETAARIGKKSTGAMRADGWSNVPLVRITNVNLMPGDRTFQQILGGIDDGIYMDGVKAWSIDDERRYFQFGCEIGWLIKGGKLAEPIKNPTYSGCTTDFWNKCRAIADVNSYRIWGTPNCGKGQPGQSIRTAQGASPARFDGIDIGGQA
jgi:TldD protein